MKIKIIDDFAWAIVPNDTARRRLDDGSNELYVLNDDGSESLIDSLEALESAISHNLEIAIEFVDERLTIDDFQVGTPATYMGKAGEVVMRDSVKCLKLYPDDNYSGRSERIVRPDWSKVESFYQNS